MSHSKQPNRDNRKNNVERLQEMIENTEQKLHDAETSMEFLKPEEQKRLHEKNERRKSSIAAMKMEMEDEMNARRNGEL